MPTLYLKRYRLYPSVRSIALSCIMKTVMTTSPSAAAV